MTLRNNCKLLPSVFGMHNIDLQDKAGPSSQLDFYTNERTVRNDSKIVAMHHGWTSKKVSEVRFRDTHRQLFEGNDLKWNPNRADQLM